MSEINISKLVEYSFKSDYKKTLGEEKDFKNKLYEIEYAYKYTNNFTRDQRRFIKYILPELIQKKEPKIYEIMKLYDLQSDLIIYIREKDFCESDDEDCNKFIK